MPLCSMVFSLQNPFLVTDLFCLQCRRPRFHPWVRKIPCRRKWQPIPVFLPGECYGQRSLAGYSRWGCKESDMTEHLTLLLFEKAWEGLPLVPQWMRICLPMQATTVQSLAWDDCACQGATRLVPHSSWACTRARKLQLLSLCAAATETRARACAQQREATSMKSLHRTTKIQYNQK